MKRIAALVVFLTLFTGHDARAADSLSVSAQIRHRFEVDDRSFTGADARTYGLLRSRLNLRFDRTDDLSGFIQIQDSRTMGEETSTLTDGSADNLDVHQAWVRVRKVFDSPLDATLGRMEASYGSERLIGAVGWHNIGRSFDGIVVGGATRDRKAKADAFYFTEVEKMNPGDLGDRRILGLYGEIAPWSGEALQPFVIWQRQVPSRALSRVTIGFRATGDTGGWKHDVEAAYQTGDLAGLDVQAWMAAANVSRIWSTVSAKPEVSAGVDYLSGDDQPASGKLKVFDTLYATNHKFYGFMDYFVNIPADTWGAGLMDAHGAVSVQASPRVGLSLAYHLFRAAEEIDLGPPGPSRDFGQELDFTARHKYNDALSVTAGASTFMPGTVFETIRGDDTTTWFYLMTTVAL